jgi:outer membrane protein assembly factor BamB
MVAGYLGSARISVVTGPRYRRLDALIGDSILLAAEVHPPSGRVRLRLAAPGGPAREQVVLFHDVTRVAACLRQVRDGVNVPSDRGGLNPASRDVDEQELITGAAELNRWLRCWSGHDLYDQPETIVDAAFEPPWLREPSLDLAWPASPAELHTLDLRLGDNPDAGGRVLDLRLEFGGVEVRPGGSGTPTGRRPPPPGARRQGQPGTGGVPRRRAPVVVAAVASLAVLAAAGVSWRYWPHRKSTSSPAAVPAPGHPAGPKGLPAAISGLLPWHLAVPLSREVVVPRGPGGLMVLGGLTAGGSSADGVYAVRTKTGATRQVGVLRAPVHDAAGAALGGHALVFGGGSSATVSTVDSFPKAGPAAMPAPRSDSVAVTIGRTVYVLGGYDGTRPQRAVLATTNGRTFTTVAQLAVPVRYPAAAALGGQIYVFGGQAVTGARAGMPLDTIQLIDPARHTATVIGHLPEPLAGAVAVTVGHELFLAGGQSTAPQPQRPGVGTTQLGAGEMASGGGSETGTAPTFTVSAIWAFDPATRHLLPAGRLQVPVSHAGVAVTGSTAWIVGGESHGSLVAAVQMLRPDRAFGTAGVPGAGSPYFGAKLLIADRGNNRLLLLSDTMHLVWKYPSRKSPVDKLHFYFPDDAFFTDHGHAIISNQEKNDTIVKIGYPSGKILWSFGHPGVSSSARGYLHEPDDAYLLKNGQVTVADANNCRVLVINPDRTVAQQIGTNGVCVHHPPASMGSPNGDTPLPDGNLLISEINGSWVSEYTRDGKLVWTVKLPISYPSDPQQLGPDRYLIADYARPGQILEFNRKGQILYRYRPASGPGLLDHPSLTELLPSGVFLANDDYNNRVVAVDPATGALVWQYGVTGRPGTGPGHLHTPDGFDLLLPNGTTPTHRSTG